MDQKVDQKLSSSMNKSVQNIQKGRPNRSWNYRGISIMNAMAKIYDMVINARFNLWHKPRIEQSGAQKGMGERTKFLLPDY